MPTPQEILRGLQELANGWRALAVFWHAYFGALLLGFAWGVRPERRLLGILLALPLLSVSILAWTIGNPFNGTVFALAALALATVSLTLPAGPVPMGPLWTVNLGALLFAFGWVYPHFLETSSPLAYLYAAPTGLVPCPTLSIVVGMSLLVDGLGSKAWCLVLAASGIFYGIFGAFRLGVTIDVVLIAGAGALSLVPFL